MKKYWRDLGTTYAAMSTQVRFTFTLMCFLPSVLLMPIVWYLSLLSGSVAAEAQLLSAIASGVKPGSDAYNALVTGLFSASPGLLSVIIATLAVIAIGNIVFVLAHFAGVMSKPGDKPNAELSGATA